MNEASVASYYRATAHAWSAKPALEGHHEAEVVVVGGGLAGLNTLMGLVERGHRDVCLLEAETVGHGASGRNGGFVFAGYSRGERALLNDLGAEAARVLFGRTVQAVHQIRERIRTHAIACDMVDAGVLWANWFRDPGILRRRQRLLSETFGVEWEWIQRSALEDMLRTQRYSGALYERNAMHLHPLDYTRGLARVATEQGANIHEHSPAVDVQRHGGVWRVRTPHGDVQARHVVLACGGYLAGLQARVDRAILPIATYVMVTEPLGARLREAMPTDRAVYDTRFAFDYYRRLPGERLLWGGRISIRNRSPTAVRGLLRKDLARVFPQLGDARIEHAWSGWMSYARHEMPQIGGSGDGLWWAQAFGGHGLAPTTVAGNLIADAIAGEGRDWHDFDRYGLVSAWRPFGYLAAQASYWWLQARDAWTEWREHH